MPKAMNSFVICPLSVAGEAVAGESGQSVRDSFGNVRSLEETVASLRDDIVRCASSQISRDTHFHTCHFYARYFTHATSTSPPTLHYAELIVYLK